MKILIWVATAFGILFLNEILGLLIGFKLGPLFYVPIILGLSALFNRLLDRRKLDKIEDSSGKTIQQLVKENVPEDVLNEFRKNYGNNRELRKLVDEYSNQDIPNEYLNYLYEKFKSGIL